ncbi:MAG: hypothetical protein AAF533_05180 [Acidobacteriota bacterium]
MQELSRRFVTAADEVYRLQSDDDPECRSFRRWVNGEEKPVSYSMQGTYVFSPSGELLARRNSMDPSIIADTLRESLDRWKTLSTKQRKPAKLPERGFRWEDSYPEGGLVLRRTVRDLPRSGSPDELRSQPFNRDSVWFTRDEARSWLPARPRIGDRHRLPEALAMRLARLSLADNVRGQTLPFHADEIEEALVFTRVTGVRGSRVELAIAGRTAAMAPGPWPFEPDNYWAPKSTFRRAISTELSGRAVFDRRAGEFVELEMLALGRRSGLSENNGRRHDREPAPIGFAYELAPAHWRVAPTFINMYEAEWVKQPR